MTDEGHRLADEVSHMLALGVMPPPLDREPRPVVTLVWLARRVYGNRARVARADMQPDTPLGVVRLRVDLLELRGGGRHRLDQCVSREEIATCRVDVIRLSLDRMHAQLERELGSSVSWAEFLASRPIQVVRGRSSFVHERDIHVPRCFTFKPDLLCVCGAFVVAWDGKLPE